MRSGRGGRRWRVLAYARGIYVRSDISLLLGRPSSPLYGGARSRDPVQVDYRCMRTLISLGLLGFRMSILFLGCSMYANDEDPRGRSLVNQHSPPSPFPYTCNIDSSATDNIIRLYYSSFMDFQYNVYDCCPSRVEDSCLGSQ
jgi:hypothetical protein